MTLHADRDLLEELTKPFLHFLEQKQKESSFKLQEHRLAVDELECQLNDAWNQLALLKERRCLMQTVDYENSHKGRSYSSNESSDANRQVVNADGRRLAGDTSRKIRARQSLVRLPPHVYSEDFRFYRLPHEKDIQVGGSDSSQGPQGDPSESSREHPTAFSGSNQVAFKGEPVDPITGTENSFIRSQRVSFLNSTENQADLTSTATTPSPTELISPSTSRETLPNTSQLLNSNNESIDSLDSPFINNATRKEADDEAVLFGGNSADKAARLKQLLFTDDDYGEEQTTKGNNEQQRSTDFNEAKLIVQDVIKPMNVNLGHTDNKADEPFLERSRATTDVSTTSHLSDQSLRRKKPPVNGVQVLPPLGQSSEDLVDDTGLSAVLEDRQIKDVDEATGSIFSAQPLSKSINVDKIASVEGNASTNGFGERNAPSLRHFKRGTTRRGIRPPSSKSSIMRSSFEDMFPQTEKRSITDIHSSSDITTKKDIRAHSQSVEVLAKPIPVTVGEPMSKNSYNKPTTQERTKLEKLSMLFDTLNNDDGKVDSKNQKSRAQVTRRRPSLFGDEDGSINNANSGTRQKKMNLFGGEEEEEKSPVQRLQASNAPLRNQLFKSDETEKIGARDDGVINEKSKETNNRSRRDYLKTLFED